jgi:hypothetical protein
MCIFDGLLIDTRSDHTVLCVTIQHSMDGHIESIGFNLVNGGMMVLLFLQSKIIITIQP